MLRRNIINDLDELLNTGIISRETADKIQQYYNQKDKKTPDRLLIIFAVIGAILSGLGIILILAHNWDDLSRTIKTLFAFIPLLIGHFTGFYVIFKKYKNTAWREGVATFLFFAIGASISLISQIYHIPGNFSNFLLSWMLLSLPLIYILQSSLISLLYLTGITVYAIQTGYYFPAKENITYWLLFLPIFPFYYRLHKVNKNSNFLLFHHWLVPLSFIICLGLVAVQHGEFLYISYMCLFGLLYLIGKSPLLNEYRRYNNSYLLYGSAGSIVLLLIVSFEWFWRKLTPSAINGFFVSPEFLATALILGGTITALVYNKKHKIAYEFPDFLFLFFILLFFIGMYASIVTTILINLLIFITGILTIRKGARLDHLGLLNYGLIIITALIICRFFDTNLSFILRGILFLIVGIGFFLINYMMIHRRKKYDQ